MKVLSLFSGVGGFDLGLENAGMETVFQCEWDKHATKILERHWPHVPRWDDVSTLTGEYILRHAPVIDVVAWGSPCQDLSVAGKRAGLQGARSGLFHEGVRIIKELRELTDGKYPRISIWENVAGALSSGGGADFGQVLYEMDEAGACFSEWRILDAQYFGVPQRRRRVFLISVFDTATATRCPDPLLPVSEGVQWHPQTGNTTRQTVASETSASFGSGSYGGWTATDTAITLSARDHKGGNTVTVEPFTPSQFAQYVEGVGTLRSNGGDLAGGSETLAVYTKSKRPQSATDDETWVANQPNPTLNAFDQGDTRATTVIVGSLQARDHKGANHEGARDGKLITEPIVFENSYRDAARIAEDGITQTLTSKMGTGGGNTPMVAFGLQGNMIGRQDHNGPQGAGISQPDDPMFSLTSTDRHGVVQYDGYNQRLYEDDVSVTIRIGRDSSDFIAQPAQTTMAVRRLTPLECERLMGWPDDWTAGQSDTHRYKQCGNGVASPVATWIAQRLMELDQ